jgi:hypothetical protein
LWDAIKREDKPEIRHIVDQESYAIDAPVTDTGMSALQFACSWS